MAGEWVRGGRREGGEARGGQGRGARGGGRGEEGAARLARFLEDGSREAGRAARRMISAMALSFVGEKPCGEVVVRVAT